MHGVCVLKVYFFLLMNNEFIRTHKKYRTLATHCILMRKVCV